MLGNFPRKYPLQSPYFSRVEGRLFRATILDYNHSSVDVSFNIPDTFRTATYDRWYRYRFLVNVIEEEAFR